MLKKRLLVLCIVALVGSSFLLAYEADTLYKQDKLIEAKTELTRLLSGENRAKEQSEILWRLARVTLGIGDEEGALDAPKSRLFELYEEAQSFAESSIELFPSPEGYQWKASSIGRWGETKGPLNSLVKAAPMRRDLEIVINEFHDLENTNVWYVLGQLYFQLPGKPLSFGNLDAAISYTRRAVDTISSDDLYPGHYLALAKMLWKRNWSTSKRTSKIADMEKEFKKSAEALPLDHYWYYEGAKGHKAIPFYSPVALGAMSDRQEAIMVLQYITNVYHVWPFHTRAEERAYQDIQQLLSEYR